MLEDEQLKDEYEKKDVVSVDGGGGIHDNQSLWLEEEMPSTSEAS